MQGRGSRRGRPAPAWGGAGRGRGGAGRKPAAAPDSAEPTPAQTERRFAEACAQIRAASEKHVSQYQLSDSEDEREDVDDDTRDRILGQSSDLSSWSPIPFTVPHWFSISPLNGPSSKVARSVQMQAHVDRLCDNYN